MEEWKTINGYGEKYQVSNLGRIRTLGGKTWKQPRIKETTLSNGYVRVVLVGDGKRKNEFVHKLVAEAFLDNPMNKTQVDHINTITTDNNVNNLRWVSCSENANNPLTRKHKSISKSGNNNPMCKENLSNEQYETQLNRLKSLHQLRKKSVLQLDINSKRVIKSFDSIKSARDETGIDGSSITNVCKGKRISAGGYCWKYVEG